MQFGFSRQAYPDSQPAQLPAARDAPAAGPADPGPEALQPASSQANREGRGLWLRPVWGGQIRIMQVEQAGV